MKILRFRGDLRAPYVGWASANVQIGAIVISFNADWPAVEKDQESHERRSNQGRNQ